VPMFEACLLNYLLAYLLTYLLTYSIQHSPSWKANWFSASQEIPCILWKLEVHCRNHKCPPHVPVLRQINPVHAPLPTSRRSILILRSLLRLGLPSGLFPSGLPTKTLYTSLLSPICVTCPVHLILLYVITRIFGEENRSLSSSLCSFPHSHVTTSFLGQIFSSASYSQTTSA
jgi:hypothetical protein